MKVYIFDVDGTLTPSRRPMTEEFLEFFNGWSKRNPFYLVSGSDLDKMKEQVPEFILERAEGVFTCGGNQFWQEGSVRQLPIDWKLIYEHKFEPSERLIKYLELELRYSPYLPKCGNHIENRGAMVNFSVIGRDCTLEQRLDYFKYDTEKGERKRITEAIKRQFPELNAVIGGQISIDIAKKGFDKSQVIFEIMHRNIVTSKDDYIFIGDRTMEGGNDYPLAKVMKELENCRVFQAGEPSAEDGYIKTREILEKLND
jgi:phosphomannomutase